MKSTFTIPLLLLVICKASLSAAEIDFNRDIRPILSNACFKCHGPDDQLREAGLRLDDRAAAIGELDSGMVAIVPGKPDESELLARIMSDDPDVMMPPPSANKTLSDKQKQLLRDWIAAGAEYQPHWSFVPPERKADGRFQKAEVRAEEAQPEIRNQKLEIRNQPSEISNLKSQIHNPIDAFIVERLAREGLSMSPEADRRTLVRRVYLDLIGLPPSPEQANAFVNDPAPDAYEKLVDQLLASPHYGERWARRWLDLARYSDTNGYEKDRQRTMWLYRDWVIKSLNDDMPFDQFTIRQIAGDMLPGATNDDRVATGFHRNTMLNEEGGIDPQEFRFYSNVDRVGTTGATWLGLTLACTQCHTHKYDPITHTEFYQLLSFFDQANEPKVEIPTPDVVAQRSELEAKIAAIEAEIAAASLDEIAFAQWVEQQSPMAVAWQVLEPNELKSNLPYLDKLPDNSVLASGDQTKLDVYELKLPVPLSGVTALRLEALPHPSLPAGGPGRVYYEGTIGDFFLSEMHVKLGEHLLAFGTTKQTAGDAKSAVDDKTETGWSIGGAGGRSHQAVFVLDKPLGETGTLDIRMEFEKYHAAALGRFRISATTATNLPDKLELPVEIEAILATPANDRTAEQQAQLRTHYRTIAPEFEEQRKQIAELRKQIKPFVTALVMQQRPADRYRQTPRYHRGEFLQPRETVSPGGIAALHPLNADGPKDRLAFAKWLVDRNNPLVARVTMNRHWAAFFGKGLVRTMEDFGTQGQLPSHPALLDWLAVEFMDRGWSQKAMHRLMVTSATYRQSSAVTPELAEADPENRLLARGPRVRLEAEVLRDAVLSVAGLLSLKMNGPSVFPPQLPSITTEGAYGALNWKPSEGEDRYRRSLYTFSKRTTPFAMFSTFDAPSGEACVPRRDSTNTPLQALTLLNDAMLYEAAEALGKQLAASSDDDTARIKQLFTRCLTREPAADELPLLLQFIEQQRQRLNKNEPLVWTALARAVLNLDEFVVRQ